jgi:uncharacterized protein
MKNLAEIKDKISLNRRALFSKYPIQSLAIFGSFSRKEQTESSDVDILVEFKENIGIKFIDLADELEQLLGIKVDLVSKKGIKEKYLRAIENDLIYV